jgi:hypothetical protein
LSIVVSIDVDIIAKVDATASVAAEEFWVRDINDEPLIAKFLHNGLYVWEVFIAA